MLLDENFSRKTFPYTFFLSYLRLRTFPFNPLYKQRSLVRSTFWLHSSKIDITVSKAQFYFQNSKRNFWGSFLAYPGPSEIT